MQLCDRLSSLCIKILIQTIILSISIVSALSFSLPLSWIQKDMYALEVRVKIRDSLNLRRSQTENVRSAIRIELLQSRGAPCRGPFCKTPLPKVVWILTQ